MLAPLPSPGKAATSRPEGSRSEVSHVRIESYRFGELVVDGKKHKHDIMVYQGRVADWWRSEGHRVEPDDLTWLLGQQPGPEVLVIGTGQPGLVEVPEETLNNLRDRGIEPRVHPTPQACDVYNELLDQKRVACALHLTC